MLEEGGNVVANNTIYDDTPSTALKYVSCDLRGGGGSGNSTATPNIYENNHVLGNGPSTQTFCLDSAYKHIIRGNTGITEAVTKNSQMSGVAGVSNLAESDTVEANYRADGTPLSSPSVGTKTKTSAYTATTADQNKTIFVDATGGAFAVTLPDAGTTSYPIIIKRSNSGGNAVTVNTTSSQTIDGATSKVLGSQWATIAVQSNGSNYAIVNQLETVN